MKTFLVTSRITFVPQNYDSVILGLADDPNIAGLIVVDNRSVQRYVECAKLSLVGAIKLASQLLRNILSRSHARRIKTFTSLHKKVLVTKKLNSPEFIAQLAQEDIDILFNARTRVIYGKKLLKIPKIACLNVHHGILPDQRGLMCDLWALDEGKPAGFSIHEMTEKVDAGLILYVEKTSVGEKNYLAHLQRSSLRELQAIKKVLNKIAKVKKVVGQENTKTPQTQYYKNLSWDAAQKMLTKGLTF